MMEPTAPKKFYLLPEDVRNGVLAYLAQRPYAEVANGVRMLEALAEIPPPVQPEVQLPPLAVVPDKGD